MAQLTEFFFPCQYGENSLSGALSAWANSSAQPRQALASSFWAEKGSACDFVCHKQRESRKLVSQE